MRLAACVSAAVALGVTAGAGAAAPTTPPKHPKADHYLPATRDNQVWGGFPIDAPPVATVRSGETVALDTVSPDGATNALSPTDFFGLFGVKPAEILPDATSFWESISGGRIRYGTHPLIGPIYVDGAEPGDTLEIQILSLKARVPFGINSTAATRGVFSLTYPGWREGDQPVDIPAVPAGTPGGILPDQTSHLYRSARVKGREMVLFSKDIRIPASPFMGVMAVAPRTGVFVGRTPTDPPPATGVQSSGPNGPYGGNFDTKDLTAGTSLYLPVFQKGAQFFTGDGHQLQGGGEVSGGALEQSLSGTFRFVLHKGVATDGPWAEDDDAYTVFGIDHDLDRAMKLAVANTVDFLIEEKGLTPAKAQSLASLAVDFNVAEAVDGTQIIVGKIPKDIFLKGR
ncbi:MAG: acetamidase/formamidase family protein [Thermoleophilia bacterium]